MVILINKFMKYLDYLFLRIFKRYEKREKDIPLFASRSVLTVIISVTIMDFSFFVEDIIIGYRLPTISKIDYFVILLIIFGFVFLRYNKKRLQVIKQNYINEPLSLKKKRGWLIVGNLLFIFLYPIVRAYIEHHM